MLASYSDPNAVFIVPDAGEDWRFKGNPYSVKQGGGLAFYAAANVHLPVPPAEREKGLPPTLASGALCLIDQTPRAAEAFSSEEREVLTDFAEMISREFQLGFEQRRREVEAEQTAFIGRFLREALVLPCQPQSLVTSQHSSGSDSSPTPRQSQSWPSPSSGTGTAPSPPATSAESSSFESPTESLFAVAARQLCALTHASSAAILDLRSFRPSTASPRALHHPNEQSGQRHYVSPTLSPRPSPPFHVDEQQSTGPRRPPSLTKRETFTGVKREERGAIALMGHSGDIEWRDAFGSPEKETQLSHAVEETLESYYKVCPLASFICPPLIRLMLDPP